MIRLLLAFLAVFAFVPAIAQYPQTPFEQSGGKRSATWQQCIDFYRALDSASDRISLREAGPTDAGVPLQVVTYHSGKAPAGKAFPVLINNSIHPGEPDGMDACMMLLRDLAAGKISLPDQVVLYVIPVYNIGGALNRGSYSRVNQDGPEEYGFRGNAQNYDLNRDFTKNDSREAQTFAQIFHAIHPLVFIDNHVSDGADYQHTMTLLSTQYDKLGKALGGYMRDSLDPAIYRSMAKKGWPMIPYVNAEDSDPRKGWTAFYDPPRFSNGYAALFHTIAYTPETHMLKPFRQRVLSTYDLMRIILTESARRADAIIAAGNADIQRQMAHDYAWPLNWIPDTSTAHYYTFLGYEPGYKTSEVTGAQRLYYDRSRPFTANIPIHDHYVPGETVQAPEAYVLPAAWHRVAERLQLQGIQMIPFRTDTNLTITAYHIDDYKTLNRAYEGHYKHYEVKVTPRTERIHFRKGDYYIPLDQPGARFLVEMLEPTGDDSYFAWNFFDPILQQKEGYSDYRWEDVAAAFLRSHPEVQAQLDAKRQADKAFAQDAAAQLKFVYQHSPWYEPMHLRYPVYRINRGAGR